LTKRKVLGGRKERQMRKSKLLTIIMSLMLVLCLGLLANPFASVSYAQGQAKVVVRSANIRESADANSTVLGSAAQGATVTINGQATDAAGTVWYQVFVNADTLGYIRSDLVELVDENATNVPDTSADPTAEVTEVHPMSASVSGSESVRVRSDASTGSQIVAQARNGLAITVTGYANGTDSKLWYRVNFIADGSEVVGFIRSDYVTLSGELVDKTDEPQTPEVDENQPQDPVDTQEPPVETKDWDTEYDGEKWVLIDRVKAERWDINQIFETVKNNQLVLEDMQEENETQTIIIILLVILAIVMGGFIAALVFKIKDMRDSAYVAQVERETLRRRNADRPAQDRKVMHTVGTDKKPGQGGQRPAGAKPVGSKPAGVPGQGGQRPAGTKPAGAPGQAGQRPAGTKAAGVSGQGGQRPAGAKPVGSKPIGNKPTGAPTQGNRSANTPKSQQNTKEQNPNWKSKNFMAEDDEFEFEFLNWDGEE